ncbi:MAG: efflux RND transporter periplasmic adaptor subunit [Gammaproteobacteria bacterium]|jgi:membrane fusion protein (multidrug efflux system)
MLCIYKNFEKVISILIVKDAKTEHGQKTIERNTDLYERNLISEQEKDEIIINNRIYEYEMAQTEAMLEQKIIRSPLTGIIVDSFLEPGEYVGESPILEVAQLDPLFIEAIVPSKYFGKIAKGDTAEVTLANPLNSEHLVKVEIADRVLDAGSGTFGVRLILINPNYLLPAGLKCDVNFDLNDI